MATRLYKLKIIISLFNFSIRCHNNENNLINMCYSMHTRSTLAKRIVCTLIIETPCIYVRIKVPFDSTMGIIINYYKKLLPTNFLIKTDFVRNKY